MKIRMLILSLAVVSFVVAGCGSATKTVTKTTAPQANPEAKGEEVAKEVIRHAEGLPEHVAPLAHPIPMFPRAGETPRYPQPFREGLLKGCDPHLGSGGTAKMLLCACIIQRSEAKMTLTQFQQEEAARGPMPRTVIRECQAEAVGMKT